MKPHLPSAASSIPTRQARLCFALLLALILTAAPAVAQDNPPPPPLPSFDLFQDMPGGMLGPSEDEKNQLLICLGQRILAAVTCKPDSAFNYLTRRNGVLLFSGFYASDCAEFYCQFREEDGLVILSSSAWGKTRYTVPFTWDDKKQCYIATVRNAMCDRTSRVRCCTEKKPSLPGQTDQTKPEGP